MIDPNGLSALSEFAEADPVFRVLMEGYMKPPVLETAPTSESLIRYFAGDLTDNGAREVEELLTRSKEGRLAARDTRRQLARLQATPIGELRLMAQENSADSGAARAWIAITERRIRAVETDRGNNDRSSVYDESLLHRLHTNSVDIRSMISSLTETARSKALALEISLQAIANQVRFAMQRSTLAEARGQSDSTLSFHGALNAGCDILTSFIDADGDLLCEIALRSDDPDLLARLDGAEAKLLLESGGMRIVIGSAVVARGRAEWQVKEVGELLGIIDAPLSAQYLAIAISQPDRDIGMSSSENGPPLRFESIDSGDMVASNIEKPAQVDAEATHYAPILDVAGVETNVMPVEVVVAPVVLQGADLVLAVTLPPVTRAAYPNHLVSVDFAAGPGQWQRLGEWPISDFGAVANVLRISFAEIAPAVRFPGEWLRFQLREPAG